LQPLRHCRNPIIRHAGTHNQRPCAQCGHMGRIMAGFGTGWTALMSELL
jgi:hypothetical protein